MIVGGSQGAQIFDEIIHESILKISKIKPLKIIHQTSQKKVNFFKKFYSENNVENIVFNFDNNLDMLISQSDLCITRAGASSLAEIAILNVPFIAIPLPSSKDNHQFENANFYQKLDCCWVIDQKILDKTKLMKLLNGILENKNEYINKSLNLKKLNDQNLWNNVNQKILEIINEN
jgi:UDP-N-acetylglucosamine--N-acetylmuramyl-(pentapeptide) pyrophosphoryl-undecaprenol N-acetylglucosamine transferase